MKKVLSIVLCMAMLMSSLSFCFPALAIQFDFGVESAENYAQTTEETAVEADLMAATYTKSNGEPGLNLLTGTTAGLDFEKSAIGDFVTYPNNLAGTTVTLATKGTTTNAANVAVKIAAHSDNQWFDVTPFALNNTATVTEARAKTDGPSLPVLLDLDRTYTVSFDYIAQGEVVFINTAATVQDSNGRNYELRRDTLNSEEWATYSHNFNGSEFSYDGTQAKAQKLFLTRRANIGTGDYYFDNISIVPNYKVTYNYNNGTDTTEVKYALPEAVNGVRTLTPDSTIAPTKDGYVLAGWATTEAATEAAESFVLGNADVELFAVWQETASYASSNGEPGLNLLTGTTAGLDFEKSTMDDFKNFDGDVSFAIMATDANSANKALKIAKSSQNNYFDVTPFALNNTAVQTAESALNNGPSLPVVLDTDRKYTVSFDYIANGEVRFINTAYGLDDNGTRNFLLANPTINSEEWAKYSITFNGSEFTYDGTNTRAQRLFLTRKANYGTGDYYFDNISIVPNYRVTYNYNNGTDTTEVKYVLPEAVNGVRTLTPDSTIAPTKDGYVLAGWATTEAATEAAESFVLGNADVELFAVWQETASYASSNGEPGLNLLTGTTAGLDFEKSTMDDFKNFDGDVSFAIMATDANSANKALKIAKSSQNNYFDVTPFALNNTAVQTAESALNNGPSLPVVLDTDRKYTVSFDYIASGEIRFVNTAYGLDDNGAKNFLIANPTINSETWAKYSITFNGSDFTYDGTNTKTQRLFLARKANYGTGDYYIDNFSIVPNYKVTYNYNNGTDTTEVKYALPEAVDGVRTLTPDAEVVPTRDGYKFLGWATTADGEVVSEVALANADVELFAVWQETASYKSSNGEPGLNLLTGTTAGLDFEKSAMEDFKNFDGDVSFATMATEENSENTALKIAKSSQNNYFDVTPFALNNTAVQTAESALNNGPSLPVVLDTDRKYTVSFDYIAQGEIRFVNTAYGLDDNGAKNFLLANPTINSEEWAKYSITFNGSEFTYDGTNTKAQRLFLTRKANYGTGDYYFDNISIVPNYKVTYIDGETETSEYILPEADAQGVRVFAPTATLKNVRGRKFLGWSTDPNATTAMSEITLGNKDITLYAVWETKWAAPGLNVLTGNADAIDFENTETADFWTVSSEVTTMATEENDANKAMKMTYASNVTNFFNLTPFANNWLTPEDKNVNGGDGPSTPTVVEDDRPVTITFNYIADDEFRLSNTAYGANDVGENKFIFHYGTIPTNGEWSKYTYEFTGADMYAKVADLSPAILLVRVNTKGSSDYYFDNISLVPHYKVTYNFNNGTDETAVKYALPEAIDGVRTLTPDAEVVPTRDGYVFTGWATESTATEAVDGVVLGNEDITLYAVWEKCEPITLNTASLRTNNNQGIRYAGYVSKSMRDIANVEEYGYIVAAEYKFDNGDYSELKFNANGDVTGELDNVAANYASAAAYTKGGRDYSELLTVEQAKEQARFSDEVLSGIDEIGYYFSAVVTNIPEEHYNDKLVGKTYIKVNGSYYYGEAIAMSIYEVAVAYKVKYEAEGISVPQYILDVISVVEGAANN